MKSSNLVASEIIATEGLTNKSGIMLRKRAIHRNSVKGSRQRESEIVQDALQGEHREEVLRKAEEENQNQTNKQNKNKNSPVGQSYR